MGNKHLLPPLYPPATDEGVLEVAEGSGKRIHDEDRNSDNLEDGRDGEDSDLVDTAYECESENTTDDENWLVNIDIDDDVVKKGSGGGDSDDSEDDDLVYDGDDFDEIRDSDNEEKDNQYLKFNNEDRFNPSFDIDMAFGSKDEFRKAVHSHAVVTKRSLYLKKNDKIRIYARCRADGCSWGINLLKVPDEETFIIRKYTSSHTCAPTFKVSNLKSKWLGERFLSNFQNDSKRNVLGWRKDVMTDHNVRFSRQQAYRAKSTALEIIEGIPDLQYSRLWDYSNELKRSNPGSTVVLSTEEIDGQERFSKMCICFQAIKKGFTHCRPFIGVDGCWLKGSHGGVLLSAVGVDPSNALYPIAYAVVSKENTETWEWFLIMLKNDLNILRGGDYTFMSDKQKGLIKAIGEVFPDCEHRFCVRHMHNNFQKEGNRGLEFKNQLWMAARASTVGTFNTIMRDMRELSVKAADWFADKHPRQWSKSHFSEKSKCDMLLNNVCESFNAAILDARDKPIITMLEWIRQWLMERFQRCRDRAHNRWKGILPPKIKQTVIKNMEKIGECTPIKSNNRHYEIECGDGSSYAVDLELRTCSCRRWDLSGIPCKHALAAIIDNNGDPDEFVHECYRIETYKKVYEPVLLPISGRVEWVETLFIPPLPPNFGRKAGRPTRARRFEPNELRDKKTSQKMRRQQKTVQCKKCGKKGHNKKTCTQKKGPTVEGVEEDDQDTNATRRKKQKVHKRSNVPTSGLDAGNQLRKKKQKVNNSNFVATIGSTSDLNPNNLIRRKKLEVTRNMKSSVPARMLNFTHVNPFNQNGGNENEVYIRPPVSQTRQLVDEDDTDFEALLSQVGNATHDEFLKFGMPSVPMMRGPSLYQQLHMHNEFPSMPTRQITRAPSPFVYGNLRPQFTFDTTEEALRRRIFVDGLHNFMDLSQISHIRETGKGKEPAK